MKINILILIIFLFANNAHSYEWIFNLRSKRPLPITFHLQNEALRDSKTESFSDSIQIKKIQGRIFLPIANEDVHRWNIAFEASHYNLNQTNKRLESPIPSKLTKIENDIFYSHNDYSGEAYGAALQIGSSSDEPFSEWGVTSLQVTGFYYMEQSPKSSWLLLLNYSNLRSFLPHIPLPGVAYAYSQGKQFSLFAGIPFVGLNWHFLDRFQLTYFSTIIFSNKIKLAYNLTEQMQIYTEFLYNPETFKLKGAANDEDRVIVDETSIRLGLKYPLTPVITLDALMGQTLRRRIYQAEIVSSSKDWVENIENQTFYNIQFGFRY